MRLVRDAKRAAFALEEPSYMDIAISENTGLKLKSPHAEPGNHLCLILIRYCYL